MSSDHLITLGWPEWVGLPELEIPAIKAKVDTGARTPALHAFDVREFSEHGVKRVEFKIHPRQRDDMFFRMLLGRTAINGKAVVDPSRSYLVGRKPRRRSERSHHD